MKNKTIVITGATSGIGYEMVKLLHQDNRVVVISKNIDKLNRLSKELKNIVIYKADLSNLEEVKSVAETILSDFKAIDLLINNAAVQYMPTFLDDKFNYENISKEIDINFTSVCSLTYKLLPLLLKSPKSTILNVNSALALAPKTTSAIYSATKGALNIFTQSLRYQLEKTDINVQQVFLPLVDTNMTKGRGEDKISPKSAAKQIIYGIEHHIAEHMIGKVRFFKLLLRFSPSIAKKIMKKY